MLFLVCHLQFDVNILVVEKFMQLTLNLHVVSQNYEHPEKGNSLFDVNYEWQILQVFNGEL